MADSYQQKTGNFDSLQQQERESITRADSGLSKEHKAAKRFLSLGASERAQRPGRCSLGRRQASERKDVWRADQYPLNQTSFSRDGKEYCLVK